MNNFLKVTFPYFAIRLFQVKLLSSLKREFFFEIFNSRPSYTTICRVLLRNVWTTSLAGRGASDVGSPRRVFDSHTRHECCAVPFSPSSVFSNLKCLSLSYQENSGKSFPDLLVRQVSSGRMNT
jgi:hypothetical protein